MAIPWIPLLTLGTSLLGGIFGKQENTVQNQSQSGSGTSSAVTTNNQQLSSTSNTTQNQTSNQTSTDNAAGTSTENVNRLDQTTKDQLTSVVRNLLGSTNQNSGIITSELARIQGGSDFDADAFVSGIMSSARADSANAVASATGRTRNSIGASGSSNSAAALLEAKIARDATANLAGVESNARSTAAQIKGNADTARAGSIAQLLGSQNNDLNGMLTALLNSGQQTTGATQSTNTGNTTGTTNTTGTETTKQNQVSAGTQQQQETTNTNTSGSSGTQQNDWSNLLNTIQGMFTAQF